MADDASFEHLLILCLVLLVKVIAINMYLNHLLWINQGDVVVTITLRWESWRALKYFLSKSWKICWISIGSSSVESPAFPFPPLS